MNHTKKIIHIVGAGFSGLSLATYLCDESDIEIHIFEKREKAGGLISSHRNTHGDLIESAAQSLIFNDLTKAFLEKINCSYVTQLPTAKKRFFFRSRLQQWPLTFAETLTSFGRFIYSFVTRNTKPIAGETVHMWISRIAGRPFCEYIVSPALQGIYATTSNNIDAEMIYNTLFNKAKKRKYLGLVSGLNGTQDIIDSMTAYCQKRHVKFCYNYDYQFKTPADTVVICTSAKDAQNILSKTNPDISDHLSLIKMNTVATVTGVFTKKNDRFNGFGALVPRDQNIAALGVLFNSDIFPNRSKISSETYIYSDIKNTLDFKSDIENTHSRLFQQSAELVSYHTTLWPEALPIYNSDLKNFRIKYRQNFNTNIVLHGNYLGGIGLSKILEQSVELATDIKHR